MHRHKKSLVSAQQRIEKQTRFRGTLVHPRVSRCIPIFWNAAESRILPRNSTANHVATILYRPPKRPDRCLLSEDSKRDCKIITQNYDFVISPDIHSLLFEWNINLDNNQEIIGFNSICDKIRVSLLFVRVRQKESGYLWTVVYAHT